MSNTIQTPHYLAQQAAWKMKRILPGDDLTPIIDSMHAHAAAVSTAKDAEIAGLRAELLKSLADNKGLRAEVAGLRAFVGNVLGTHREHGCCDIDGSDVQDWALAAGLLHEIEVSESCGAEDCACMEYYGEITPQNPAKCLRLTDTGQTALAARKGEATTPPPSPSPRS